MSVSCIWSKQSKCNFNNVFSIGLTAMDWNHSSNLSVFKFQSIPVLRPCWRKLKDNYRSASHCCPVRARPSFLECSILRMWASASHPSNLCLGCCFLSWNGAGVLKTRHHPFIFINRSSKCNRTSKHLHKFDPLEVLCNSELPTVFRAKGWQFLQRLISSDQWGPVATAAIFKGLSLNEFYNRCWHV